MVPERGLAEWWWAQECDDLVVTHGSSFSFAAHSGRLVAPIVVSHQVGGCVRCVECCLACFNGLVTAWHSGHNIVKA